jgi:hypothetical protein
MCACCLLTESLSACSVLSEALAEGSGRERNRTCALEQDLDATATQDASEEEPIAQRTVPLRTNTQLWV